MNENVTYGPLQFRLQIINHTPTYAAHAGKGDSTRGMVTKAQNLPMNIFWPHIPEIVEDILK